MNLDTLLVQTECIIIMWDNSSPKTFENIPSFISIIEIVLKILIKIYIGKII